MGTYSVFVTRLLSHGHDRLLAATSVSKLPQHYMFLVGSHKEEAVAESDGSGCYKVSIRDLPTLTAGEKIVE